MAHSIEHAQKLAGLLLNTLEMQSFSRVIHICHYVLETQHLEGDIVEFGCFKGDTSKLISTLTNKQIYVYDSFEGLPKDAEQQPGGMSTSYQSLIDNFQRDSIRLPNIKKCWFDQLTKDDIPKKISFAHLDGDLYLSTKQSLELIYSNMVKDGVILIDDYAENYWYGVEQAVTEFFADKPEKPVHLKGENNYSSHKALIIKN